MGFLDLPGLQYFYNKYVKGLKSHAFRDPANNLTTTESGYALDARQGKALNDKVTQLNSALTATVLYSGGGRALDYAQPWNETLSFSQFQKIEMAVMFQQQIIVLQFYPMMSDEYTHSFGFNTYNAEIQRVISGTLKFSGRYITEPHLLMQYNGDAISPVNPESIAVLRIVGYKNA